MKFCYKCLLDSGLESAFQSHSEVFLNEEKHSLAIPFTKQKLGKFWGFQRSLIHSNGQTVYLQGDTSAAGKGFRVYSSFIAVPACVLLLFVLGLRHLLWLQQWI